MNKINAWIESELIKGYSLFDRVFMISMVLLQIIVYAITPDSVLGIISGLSGVISVVLCAKGKISFYFIGFVQTISYLFLAWQNKFYGEVIENIFYIITMIWGIFIWKKQVATNNDGSTQVIGKKFTFIQYILSIIIIISLTIGMGFLLTTIGSNQAYTDAATNVLAIFAQLLMVWCYREQWIVWFIIDILCLKMWFVAGNWSMVAMYISWTINCIYGWYNWNKLSKTDSAE